MSDLYVFKGTTGTTLDLAIADFTVSSLWTHLGVPKFDTTPVATKFASVAFGDQVMVDQGYDPAKGVAGHIYQYTGTAASLDLASTNYTDQTKWLDLGGVKYTAQGVTPNRQQLNGGDVVQVSAGIRFEPGRRRASLRLYGGERDHRRSRERELFGHDRLDRSRQCGDELHLPRLRRTDQQPAAQPRRCGSGLGGLRRAIGDRRRSLCLQGNQRYHARSRQRRLRRPERLDGSRRADLFVAGRAALLPTIRPSTTATSSRCSRATIR